MSLMYWAKTQYNSTKL